MNTEGGSPLGRAAILAVALWLAGSRAAGAQRTGRPGSGAARDTSPALTLTAGEADDEPSAPRQWIRRPQWDLGFTTLHAGGGLLYDVIAYSQDSSSREQFPSLAPELKLRDARLLFGGRFKTDRSFTW